MMFAYFLGQICVDFSLALLAHYLGFAAYLGQASEGSSSQVTEETLERWTFDVQARKQQLHWNQRRELPYLVVQGLILNY